VMPRMTAFGKRRDHWILHGRCRFRGLFQSDGNASESAAGIRWPMERVDRN
jgi:hypothetical protein